jgi:hypothetical protein
MPIPLRPLAALFCLLTLIGAGCDDPECGAGSAPTAGIILNSPSGVVTYGNFRSSPNNDCTPPGASVPALTIEGQQVEPPPSGLAPPLVLCLPRPNHIDGSSVDLGLASTDPLQLVNLDAAIDSCTLAIDRSAAVAASARFRGFCDGGRHPDGYAMAITGELGIVRRCGSADEPVTATLDGEVAVSTTF